MNVCVCVLFSIGMSILPFFLVWIVPWVISKNNHSHTQGHLEFTLVLSSKCFIVLHFTFRSVIHCELIFLKDVSEVSV